MRDRWDKFPSNVKIQLRGREQELVDSEERSLFLRKTASGVAELEL